LRALFVIILQPCAGPESFHLRLRNSRQRPRLARRFDVSDAKVGWWRGRGIALVWIAMVVGVGGCDGPNIVPIAPPGVDYHQVLPQPKLDDSEKPQARGETGKNTAAAAASVLPGLVPAPPTAPGETKTMPSGVKYETLVEGQGAECKAGQTIRIHYVGTLENGQVFDSSRKKGEPATFTIGVGKVIKGWDEGVPGMKVGEKRKLTIPPSAGYGALGKPPQIPPNAPLTFELELMGIQ
jgi:FKBP-type peptidyl-prolyl cis-trans isomerase FkpA